MKSPFGKIIRWRKERMCEWGNQIKLRVPIPAHLSHTGEFRWDEKGVDSCIAPMVDSLNKSGIYTSNCCCGHGEGPGSIILHDGRELIILPPDENEVRKQVTRSLIENVVNRP